MGKNKSQNIDVKNSFRLLNLIAGLVFILLTVFIVSSYLNNLYILDGFKKTTALEIIHAHNSNSFLKDVYLSKKDSVIDLSQLGNRVVKIDFFSDSGEFSSFTPDKWEREHINLLKEMPDTFFTRYYSLNGKIYFEYLARMPLLNLSSKNESRNISVRQSPGYYRISLPETLIIKPIFKRLQKNSRIKHIIGAVVAFTLWLLTFIFFRQKTYEYFRLLKQYWTEKESNFEVIQLSPNPIFIGDTSGRFIQFNKAASMFTGYSEDELKKMKMENLFPNTILSENPLDYGSVLSGKTVVTERLLRKKNGKLATVKMYSKKLPSGRLISTMVDITEEKANLEKIIGINNMLSQSVELTNSAVAYINRTAQSILLSFGIRELLHIPPKDRIDCFIIKDYYDEEDYQYVYRKRMELGKDGESFSTEHKFYLPNGNKIWVQHTEKLIIDKKTKQKTLVVHFKDITESKRKRLLLEERDKLFSSIINTAQVGLAVFDTKAVIKKMAEIFNNQFTEENIRGLSDEQIKELLELTPIVKFNKKILETLGVEDARGLGLNLMVREDDYHIIKEIFIAVLKHQKTLEVELGAKNIKTNEFISGLCRMSLPSVPNDYSLYVSWTDISKLKKIEAELRENLKFAQKFMETAPIAVIMLNREERVTLINNFAQELLGIGQNEFREKSFFTLIPDEKRARKASKYFRKLINRETIKFPHNILRFKFNDRDIHLRLFFTLIKNNDEKVENILIIGLDVSDENRSKNELKLTTKEIINLKHKLEKKKEALEKQNKLLREKETALLREIENKNRFFSIIAHDVRSPFTSLLGLSELLKNNLEYLSNDEIKEIAEGFNKQSKHIFNLLENLLQWARSQLKQISFAPSMIELKDVVLQAAVVFKPAAENKNVEFIIDKNISGKVFADEKMIDTILRNLISNAVKFTHENGRISIKVNEKVNYYEITVSDTGMGIPADNIEKLFDFSVHYSTLGTNKEKGTGLGLVLVQEFVEKMNGRLSIKSQVGKGTSISVLLPKFKMYPERDYDNSLN